MEKGTEDRRRCVQSSIGTHGEVSNDFSTISGIWFINSNDVCDNFFLFIKILDTNWKTGNYALKFEPLKLNLKGGFKFDDDYLLFNNGVEYKWNDRQFEILNRRTMKTERVNYD